MQLNVWNGASAIIIDNKKVLMVRSKGTNRWGVPSGGIEKGETPEETCIREIWEETGFVAKITKPLHTKKTIIKKYDVTTTYFLCEITSGSITYHDPDGIVAEIAWKSLDEIATIEHEYPEDKEVLEKLIRV